jgi:uncharacterized membrane protein
MLRLKTLLVCLTIFLPVAAFAQTPGLFDVTGVASNDVLNIREAPSGSSAKIGALAFNQKAVEVITTSEDGRWGLVNSEERSGWIAMRFMHASAAMPVNLPAGLACSGTEPFWSLTLNQNGTANADWSPMGLTDDQDSVYASYWSGGAQNRNAPVYGFELLDELTGSNVKASGIIRAELCSDGMSDRDYGFAIELLLSGGQRNLVSGCCSISP